MRKLLATLVVVFFVSVSCAQTTVNGTVKSVNNEGLTGATITVQNQNKIIAFAIADIEGKYNLVFNKKTDSILLKVAYLGYQSKKQKILNKSIHLDFVLNTSKEQLREVVIKTAPVTQKKDTITYRVSALKKESDRVIADVIKRIPGITIQKNGQIYYQGKAINKFYIENMDMLEGRYNLASNNLPAGQVASVQVYENHQPIKLLDSLMFSDRAALNIKLKKHFSYAVSVYLSAGYSPILWDANITPLFFTNKYQSLISLQSNNVGKYLQKELTDFSSYQETNLTKKWLQIAQISKPDYDKKWWLDNKTHLLTFNFLTSLSKHTQIKLNTDYIYDLQNELSTSTQKIFLLTEDVKIDELVINNYNNKQLKTAVIIEQNSKKNYLKDKFSYIGGWHSENGLISNNNTHQLLDMPSKKIENSLYWLFPLGKQLLGFNSEIKYAKSNQSLQIMPGKFADIFNQSIAYNKGTQFVSLSKWLSKNSFGLTKKIGNVNVKNDVVLTYESGSMKSNIVIENNSIKTHLGKDFQNDNKHQKIELSNNLNVSMKTKSWQFGIVLPVKYINLSHSKNIQNKQQSVRDVFLNPGMWISKYFNNWHARLSVSQNHTYYDISDNYTGKIWNMYNSLQQHNMPVNQQIKKNALFMLHYKNVAEGFNATLSASYSENFNHYIYAYRYNIDGSNELYAITKHNTSYSNNYALQMAKYIFSTKTNLKLNIFYMTNNRLTSINQNFARINSNSLIIRPSVDFGLTKYLSFYFYAEFNYDSFVSGEKAFTSDAYQYNYSGKVFAYPYKNHRIEFYFDYYKNSFKQIDSDIFVNLSYRYKIPKKHIDLNIEWRNITNKKQYVNMQYFDNISLQNTYQLRPSQVLFGVRFSL